MDGLRTAKFREPAWRVHQDPMALPNLPTDGEAQPNRFDDPHKKYRVRYLATNKRGAFLEVLARFRMDTEAQARLGTITEVDEKSEPEITPGAVPKAYLRALREVQGAPGDSKLDFVDVATPESQAALNKHPRVRTPLKSILGASAKLDDASILLGGPKGRPITQAVSRVVFDDTEAGGIRYLSRLDPAEPCWAVFDWVDMKFTRANPIDRQDAALKSAALSLGLTLP